MGWPATWDVDTRNKARGEDTRHAKLTANQVREIRAIRQRTGEPCRLIALRYGVTKDAVQKICTYQTWGHVL